MSAAACSVLSAACFGLALITGRIGLRDRSALAGAAISIPTATALLLLCAPFAWTSDGYSAHAVAAFAAVGLFFPAAVTLITFRSNEVMGPTVTAAVSGTAPLFALLAAGAFLGEQIPLVAAGAALAVAAGIALLASPHGTPGAARWSWSLLWPLGGALVRGIAQAGAKAALLLWPNPFAAGVIGYTVSSATVLAAHRLDCRGRRRSAGAGMLWFALTGALNGAAVLLMYFALSRAPVALVAPIVATYPLVTALASAFVLRERISRRQAAGAGMTVAAIAALLASTA